MGELNQHDLSLFDANIFIETGTGKGVGLQHARQFPFKAIHTIEIIPELHEIAKTAMSDERVTFHLGHSVEILEKILPSIAKEDKILFWLDAHFPGVDFGLGTGGYVYDENNIPSDRELKTIKKLRPDSKDSIILDDLRLYENGAYQLGDLDIGKPKSGIKFVEDLFAETHVIRRDYRHQGFLIIIPKN